jgi:hypothetical protein
MKNLKTLTALFIFLGFATFSYAQLEVSVAAAAKCECDIPSNHAKDSVYTDAAGTKYVIQNVTLSHRCLRSICLIDECKYKLSLKNAAGGSSIVELTAGCKFTTAVAYVDELHQIGNRNSHPANGELLISAFGPNPIIQGQNIRFDVELPEAGGFGIEVYNLTGQVVMSQAFNNKEAGVYETTLFTNKLTQGHYFVKLISNGKISVQRFTVM